MADKTAKDLHTENVEDVSHVEHQFPLPEELAHHDDASLKHIERSAVRRLDTFLLPSVVLLFLLNILDRNNIASAKIVNLPQDLGITNSEYNTCLMIFYAGCKSSKILVPNHTHNIVRRHNPNPFEPHHHPRQTLNLPRQRRRSMGSRKPLSRIHAQFRWLATGSIRPRPG